MLDTSQLPPPGDREARAAFVAQREHQLARLARAELVRVVREAYQAFTSSLTAGGDLTALDGIPGAWMQVVDGLVDELTDTYNAGQVTAWVGMPGQAAPSLARRWEAVANENAVSYAKGATNRLAGAGQRTWQQVRRLVVAGVRDGLTNDQLAGQIETAVGFAATRAEVIARTESVGAYVQGDMAGARALGDQGPVEKVWVATGDNRTRDDHMAAHDQVVSFTAQFRVGGVLMDAPHAPGAPAGQVVNCRCYAEFLYAGDTRPDGTTVATGPGAALDDGQPSAPSIPPPTLAVHAAPPFDPSASAEDAERYLSEHLPLMVTPAADAALERYRGAGFRDMNALARTGTLPTADAPFVRAGDKVQPRTRDAYERITGQPLDVQEDQLGNLRAVTDAPLTLADVTRAATAEMDALIARSTTRHDLTLYRGVSSSVRVEVGAVYSDAAFSSTSLEERVARKFGYDDSTGLSTILRIRAPAGTHGTQVGGGVRIGGESEVVLARGQRMRVVREEVTEYTSGLNTRRVRYLDVELA